MYDGESVEGFNSQDLAELKNEHTDEGMSGIDPRYVINRISSAIIRKQLTSINALDVLRSIKEGLDAHASISKEERERYMDFISTARKEYDTIAKKKYKKRLCIHTMSLLKRLWIII